MSVLTICKRQLSQRIPVLAEDVVEFVRQELYPVLKELRDAFNRFSTGPYNLGTISCGTGAPVDPPNATRGIYIRLDGGAGTSLYVFEGAAWVPK